VACDGIYDVMENDQLKDFITERYTSGNGFFLDIFLPLYTPARCREVVEGIIFEPK